MIELSSSHLPGPRIVIIGVTGSGKTTTARRLSSILAIPHIELDALHWQANWVMMETEAFRQLVAEKVEAPAWIIDGNYSKARDILWERATTLVWLDYRLPVILWQLTGRTFRRLLSQQELWNGNRETWQSTFLSRDSLFLWALSSYPKFSRDYPLLLEQPENAHLQVIRLHTRAETEVWLGHVKSTLGKARAAAK